MSPVWAFVDLGSIDSPVKLPLTTVTFVLPLPLPEAALIVVCPGATAITTPAASTDATSGLLEVQFIETSLRGFPSELRAIAESLVVALTTSGALTGSISMRVTGPALTITRVSTVLPPTIAPTSTSPGLKNETVPDSSTPARSNGAANQAEAGALVLFPDASFTTTLKLVPEQLKSLSLLR